MTSMLEGCRGRRAGVRGVVGVLGVLVVCVGWFGVAPGVALAGVPEWSVSVASRPTVFRPAGDAAGDAYVVLVTNTGGAASAGPVTVTDELPEGVVPAAGSSAVDELGVTEGSAGHDFSKACGVGGDGNVMSCTYSSGVQPDDTLIITFAVKVVTGKPESLANMVRVSGGGAASAWKETSTVVSSEPAGFGISPGSTSSTLSSLQAGGHPDLTVSTAFNTENREGATSGNLKNTTFDLPPGFAGDLVDTPTCAAVDFLREECPIATQVGVTTITILGGVPGPHLQPVYNLAPEPGEVAKLGFWVSTFFYEGDIKVREPGEGGSQPERGPGEPYGLKTTFYNATAGIVAVDNVALTVWGVPADPVHDALRWDPHALGGTFGASTNATVAPFFTNPTSCSTTPLESAFKVTSWQHPEESEHPEATYMSFGPLVGCDALQMEPSLTAEATTDSAGAATGLDLATKIPQTYNNAEGLAAPTLKKETVTLPEGMTVNPSAGAGLAACSEAQYAEEGPGYVPGVGCPNASKLATVKIVTPSISEEVTGSVFLAEPAPFGEPGKNPFGSLLALYLVARAPVRGVLVKAAGEVQVNQTTGQLTTTFDGLPPLPFSIATFSFNQGANAPLVTPPACGGYEVTAALTPWSAPEASPLTPLVPPFEITAGCPAGGVPPFAPQAIAGTQDNQAGSYSPMYIRVIRNDGEQELTGLGSQLPPGLTANLNGVPFCPEADIQQARAKTGVQEEASPSCPPASEIGHSIAEAGVGSVLVQTPGRLYMAGPFEGAPFSVVSVTSAHVGPFDLGTVVVHLPLQINPDTAQVSIPEGAANQIPHIIKGIVIHLRSIRVYINRPDFTLNPTSCNPMTLAVTPVGGGQDPTNPADNTPVTVNNPFQASNCQNLQFAPKFTAYTIGKASKANGASLTVKLAYPKAPQGTQTNISYVKVDLPIQLPSRLTTLQKACTEQAFNTNPATCPPASIIGHAKATTPILPAPLEGPAYFVSHGGAKFPELIMVLQGYGVTIMLHGETFITKGITSSTFHTVPDQPVTTFELTLPQGRYSALGANLPPKTEYNLCSQKLTMPTLFKAQNGQQLKQNTPITPTGCPKKHKPHHKTKHTKHKG